MKAMFRLLLLCSSTVISCSMGDRSDSSDAVPPTAVPTPATAVDSPAVHPSVVVLRGLPDCASRSGAEEVSVSMRRSSATDMLELLTAISGLAITIEGMDPDAIFLDAELTSQPWDCIIEELVLRLNLVRSTEGMAVILRPAPASPEATPHD